jgi:MFS family permease
MVGFTVGNAFIPLAPSGALLIGAACLIVQQVVGDGAATVFEITSVSVAQSVVEDRLLGRVNGTIRFFEDLCQLAGTIAGGLIAEAVGLRTATVVGLLGGVVAVAFLWLSPIRRMRTMPVPPTRPTLGDELPLTE